MHRTATNTAVSLAHCPVIVFPSSSTVIGVIYPAHGKCWQRRSRKDRTHQDMAAFVSGCGAFHGTANASRVSLSPTIIPSGRFAQVQKRARCFRIASNESVRPTTPVRMADGAPPINAPSGLLLLTSSVLAIACVGCVFELSGGHPTYGPTTTAGILAVSLPGFLFLFYSAIRKGQQEALDDP